MKVVCASDDNYCMPLAVTIRSLCEKLGDTGLLEIYVLDGGISGRNKKRLVDSWSEFSIDLKWIPVAAEDVPQVEETAHVTHCSYFRMLIPELLPENVEKVLYIDSDLLFKADARGLWETPLDGAYCLAVQDAAAPFINAEVSLPGRSSCHANLAAMRPVANYEKFGISACEKYFNGGVLLIDLNKWRNGDVAQQLLRCIRENESTVLWWDQYALNVVLAGKWKEADPRWNQGSYIYTYPPDDQPFSESVYRSLTESPSVVHFTSHLKPWHPRSDHPYRGEFFDVLDRTAWSGWRPTFSERAAHFISRLRPASRFKALR